MADQMHRILTKIALLFLLHIIVPASTQICRIEDLSSSIYCDYGCCKESCCPRPTIFYIGPIVGSVVSGGIALFIIILAICICRRRRRQPGVIIHSPGAPPTVICQNSTSQSAMVNTACMPPGSVYPSQPYGVYPYPPDKTVQPPSYYQQSPPSYDNLPPPAYPASPSTGTAYYNDGVDNLGFKS
ncbi:protein shisa-5 [Biomphalaria pfeifferi]|uniref:Protein shisa-5 n=1 Tax=Biomphalaria pfeifferi TaxID=112525 RepID=A0AAD8B194_BIOPF|nr:protein shisa-5 [Biomphalaria pfeifferi]